MFKSKVSERVQEVILPDFPDDENTVPTVTKSRRVSFGTNFVKEFIVGSAVSGQCLPEYEQAFPSSDSSTADSSHSAAEIGVMEHSMFAPPLDIHKVHKPVPPVSQPVEPDFPESRPKLPKFSSTVCFSADSPTADMEFTEGCITLAKSILDKKNKEMTVIIQAKPKEPKGEEKPKEEETKYFDGSQFEMSMTRCLKSKGNKREEKRFECEKTKIFGRYENEMSITRCNRLLNEDDSDASWEDCKENRMPLDMIMRHLDKENSDLENDLFNPEKSFDNFFNADALDLTNESEKLNLNESMDISTDFQVRGPRILPLIAGEPMGKSTQAIVVLEAAASPEKLAAAPPPEDKIDRSAVFALPYKSDLSLDECHPFERMQSPPKADFKTNKSVLLEPKEVLVPYADESIEASPTEDDRMSRSTHQLSVDVCVVSSLPEKEPLVVESVLADHKSADKKESKEIVTCGRESLVLDLAPPGKNESEERIGVDQPTNNCKSSTPTEPISLDGVNVIVTPEKVEPVVEETNKSPERMSLDGSINVLPSEIVESLADSSGNAKIDKSEHRISLGGTEDILKEHSLMELTTTDKISESAEPKLLEQPSTDKISVSTEPIMVDMPSDKINVSAEPKIVDLSSANKINESTQPKVVDTVPANQVSESTEPKMVSLPSADKLSESTELKIVDMVPVDKIDESTAPRIVDLSSADKINVSVEPSMVDLPPADKVNDTTEQMEVDLPPAEAEPPPAIADGGLSTDSLDETEGEPSLVDLKVIESLKEQSKEAGCVWSLKDLRHPQRRSQGWLSFNCGLLESSTDIHFGLKTTNEDSPVACSIVTNSEISLTEENQLHLPEYRLVVDFGFDELKKYFDERRTQVETIRHVPYFLDQINSFVVKMNGCLRQIYSILTMYPGSRLEGSRLSFRLFSFPVFFSSTVSIDLSNYFRLSKSSLSFDTDLGSFDENKIRQIFEDCLKRENSLCEFIVQSTKHLIDLEKDSGFVSKRGHIRLLPAEMKL